MPRRGQYPVFTFRRHGTSVSYGGLFGRACLPVGFGEVVRESNVSGWSGPSTRPRSARVCSGSRIASVTRPASP